MLHARPCLRQFCSHDESLASTWLQNLVDLLRFHVEPLISLSLRNHKLVTKRLLRAGTNDDRIPCQQRSQRMDDGIQLSEKRGNTTHSEMRRRRRKRRPGAYLGELQNRRLSNFCVNVNGRLVEGVEHPDGNKRSSRPAVPTQHGWMHLEPA